MKKKISCLLFLFFFVISCNSSTIRYQTYDEYYEPFKGYLTVRKNVKEKPERNKASYYILYYNENGRIIKREDFDKNDNLVFTQKYVYANNVITKTTRVDKNGIVSIIVYFYKNGTRIKEVIYDKNNKKVREIDLTFLSVGTY